MKEKWRKSDAQVTHKWRTASLSENENPAGGVSADDHVVGRVGFDDRADTRELFAANVEAFAGRGVVDVNLSRLRHRTHDEHVVARRVPLGLQKNH